MDSWVKKIHWRRDRLPTSVFLGFLCGSACKESACNAGDLGSIPGLVRSSGERKSYLLQYFGLENSMNSIDHGVPKSQTQLSNFHFHFTCLLRSLYAGQETTVRTEHGKTDWFKTGKGVHQGCILSPGLINFYAECRCKCQAE